MRVLILNWRDLHHPTAGGAEIFTWEVARRLTAAGNEVCWFAARPPRLAARDRYDGIEVVRAGSRLGVYREARRFWHSQGDRFDLVIDEVNTRPFLAPRFVRDVPVVALIHQVCREVWYAELPWPIAATGRFLFEPLWLAFYRHVPTFTVSKSSAESLAAYGLRLVTEVGVGLTPPYALPTLPKETRPTVLYVGRMTANKGPHHLMEAMRHVWKDLPAARLWMVGRGPLEKGLQRQARSLLRELALPEDRIKFFGHVDEAEKLQLMTRAWVLGMASVREGWGLVVDEAAACGTATVAYRAPGVKDSVPAARGILSDPNPKALGRAVAGQLIRQSASAGHEVAGWRGGAKSWDEVTSSLVEGVRLATGVRLLKGSDSRPHSGGDLR